MIIQDDRYLAAKCEEARLHIEGILAQLPGGAEDYPGQGAVDNLVLQPLPQLLTSIEARISYLISTLQPLVARRAAIQRELALLPHYQKLLCRLSNITATSGYFTHFTTGIFQTNLENEPRVQEFVDQLDAETNKQFCIAAQSNFKDDQDIHGREQIIFMALYPHRYVDTVQNAASSHDLIEIHLPHYVIGKSFSDALTFTKQRRDGLLAELAAIEMQLINLATRWRARLLIWQDRLTVSEQVSPAPAPTPEKQLSHALLVHLAETIVASRNSAFTLIPYILVSLPLLIGLAIGNVSYGVLLLLLCQYGAVRDYIPRQRFVRQIFTLGALWSVLLGFTFHNYLPYQLVWEQQYTAFKSGVILIGIIGIGQILITGFVRHERRDERQHYQWKTRFIIKILFTFGLFRLVIFAAANLPARNMNARWAMLIVITVILLHVTEAVNTLSPTKLASKIISYAHSLACGYAFLNLAVWANDITTAALVSFIVIALTSILKSITGSSLITAKPGEYVDQYKLPRDNISVCYSR